MAGVGEGLESFVTGCYDGCLRVYGPGCKVGVREKKNEMGDRWSTAVLL